MNLLKFINIRASLQKAGYKRDQQGIINRYLREKENWDAHLLKTRQFIINWLDKKEGNSIAVLGSGWLLDVPIDWLAQKFNQVVLFDIYHPEQIKKQVEKIPNVKLITADLTGGLINMALTSKSFSEFKQSLLSFSWPNQFNTFDFIVSVNLLAQLDILLCDFLKHRFKLSDFELNEIRAIIQQNHLDILAPGKSCLITDVSEMQIDKHENEVTRRPLVFIDFPLSDVTEEWIWKFDTHRLYHPKFNIYFQVKALTF